jgi:3'(2'), 5'-bisphosphate nucleotidase
LIDAAIAAALRAGAEVLAVYGSAVQVDRKADRSPVTEADRRSHRAITDLLAGTGLPVLSEEGSVVPVDQRQRWPRYWLVDPLDGTKEFIAGNGEFCICIALMERDALPAGPLGAAAPIGGVLYAPVTDVLYFAWSGGGAWRQRGAATSSALSAYERAAMAERLPLAHDGARPYTVVASRSHGSPETAAFIRRKEQEHGAVALANMGSALKMALVAEGTADAYPRYAPTMEWDTAAGQAIVQEAGRQVIDPATGAPLRYNKQELVNPWFIVQ